MWVGNTECTVFKQTQPDTLTCRCHSGRFLADKQCSPSRHSRRRSTAGSCSALRPGSTRASQRSDPTTRLWVPPCRRQTGSCCSPCSPPRPCPSRHSPTCHRSAAPAWNSRPMLRRTVPPKAGSTSPRGRWRWSHCPLSPEESRKSESKGLCWTPLGLIYS